MKFLAVDPSINNVGLAYYNSDTQVVRTRIFHPPKLDLAPMGASILRFIFISFLQGEKVDKLIVEYPNFQGSTKGLIAMQQGYTLDLAYICGVLAGGMQLASADVMLPTPLEWKGNQPKAATELRVQRWFGTLQISEHEYDALGLLLYAMKKVGIA